MFYKIRLQKQMFYPNVSYLFKKVFLFTLSAPVSPLCAVTPVLMS